MNYLEEREKAGATGMAVSRFIGVSPSWLRNLERGRINLDHPRDLEFRKEKIARLEKFYLEEEYHTPGWLKITPPKKPPVPRPQSALAIKRIEELAKWSIGDKVYAGKIYKGVVVEFFKHLLVIEPKNATFSSETELCDPMYYTNQEQEEEDYGQEDEPKDFWQGLWEKAL